MKLPLFPRRLEVKERWWNRFAEVFILGITALSFVIGILIASTLEDNSVAILMPLIVYLTFAGLYHTILYIGFGSTISSSHSSLKKIQSKPKNISTESRKINKVAIHIKWCNALFLSGVLGFILGSILHSEFLVGIGAFAFLGVIYCMIAIVIFVWKSSWKYAAILSLLLGGVIGIICFFIAYEDAKKMLTKAGYSLGVFGPKEITFFGSKLKNIKGIADAQAPVKAKNYSVFDFLSKILVLLLIVGFIAILVSIVIVAINPTKPHRNTSQNINTNSNEIHLSNDYLIILASSKNRSVAREYAALIHGRVFDSTTFKNIAPEVFAVVSSSTFSNIEDAEQALAELRLYDQFKTAYIKNGGEFSSDPAITEVRHFYLSLEIGDGLSAVQSIIPEKRETGNYTTEGLSTYWRNQDVPLLLIDAIPTLNPNIIEVFYSYTPINGDECQDTARVFLEKRGINWYISKILPEKGC